MVTFFIEYTMRKVYDIPPKKINYKKYFTLLCYALVWEYRRGVFGARLTVFI